MASFDFNKSIILDCGGQSNMKGVGNWSDSSTTGLYAPYEALKSTTIDAKLICRQLKIIGSPYTSDYEGDFYEHISGFMAHTLPDANNINMIYSFVIDLMAYLNSISYTKNVIVCNFGLGGTSMRITPTDIDWGTTLELADENNMQLMDFIRYEQEVNGNDSQVISVWHQGESDQDFYATAENRLIEYYNRKKKVLGYDFPMFIGQLVPSINLREFMNDAFFDFTVSNPNAYVVGQDLSGGVNTWEKMEADDPDGIIDATNPNTYTYASDNTHYNWSAQILQGRQLFDLVMDKYFGI